MGSFVYGSFLRRRNILLQFPKAKSTLVLTLTIYEDSLVNNIIILGFKINMLHKSSDLRCIELMSTFHDVHDI